MRAKKAESNDAVEAAWAAINAVGYGHTKATADDTLYIPTGFDYLDWKLLKRGGIPYDKITEIYGPPEGGKTLLLTKILINAQRTFPDRLVGLIDTEFTYDTDWASFQGLDLKRFSLQKLNSGEDLIEALIALVGTGKFSAFGLDSLGNMEKAEHLQGARYKIDSKTGLKKADSPGEPAKLGTVLSKRMTYECYVNSTALIANNQVRAKISTGPAAGYGEQEETPAGFAFKHARSLAIRLSRVGDITEGPDKDIIGLITKADVKRSKQGVKGRTDQDSHLRFYFLQGNQALARMTLDRAISTGIITQKGAMITWVSRDYAVRGMPAMSAMLAENPDTLEELVQEVDATVASRVPDPDIENNAIESGLDLEDDEQEETEE